MSLIFLYAFITCIFFFRNKSSIFIYRERSREYQDYLSLYNIYNSFLYKFVIIVYYLLFLIFIIYKPFLNQFVIYCALMNLEKNLCVTCVYICNHMHKIDSIIL